jgi:hypothetical protein
MVVAPLLVLLMRDASASLDLLLVPCALVPWFMPHSLTGDLLIGFYCWNGSFLAMSLGCALASAAYATQRVRAVTA